PQRLTPPCTYGAPSARPRTPRPLAPRPPLTSPRNSPTGPRLPGTWRTERSGAGAPAEPPHPRERPLRPNPGTVCPAQPCEPERRWTLPAIYLPREPRRHQRPRHLRIHQREHVFHVSAQPEPIALHRHHRVAQPIPLTPKRHLLKGLA